MTAGIEIHSKFWWGNTELSQQELSQRQLLANERPDAMELYLEADQPDLQVDPAK